MSLLSERNVDHTRNCECRACERFVDQELRKGWGANNRSTLGAPEPSCGGRVNKYPSLDEMDGEWGYR